MTNGTLEQLIDAIADGVIVIDADDRIVLFNAAAGRILALRSDDVLGRPIAAIIPSTRLPAVRQSRVAELDRRLEIGTISIVTSRYPITQSDGTTIAAAVFRDTSEIQRLAEEVTNLRELRVLNEAIFDSTQDAISVVDPEGLGVMVNAAYSRVTGLQPDEVIGRPCTVDIASGKSIHMEVLRTRRPVRDRRLRVGPRKRDVIVDAAPIIVGSELLGSVAVIKDVSEVIALNDRLNDARARIRTLEARYTFDDVIGSAPAFLRAVEQARHAAITPATVILHGESGTGKELFAHAIHNASSRRNARFIKVNCASLTESLLESELFGYVEGAFTGAQKGGRPGLFEEAHGGTIFLDEIALLSRDTQGALLRVLQEREVRRVGGTTARPIDVRVIAATNRDLMAAVKAGAFREDLYYRLHVVPVDIPPLRDRRDDIERLARHLLVRINREYGRSVREIAPAALVVLQRHRWPGNVRELDNVLRRAVVAMPIDGVAVAVEHLGEIALDLGCADDEPPAVPAPGTAGSGVPPAGTLEAVVAAAERAHIAAVLASHDGNRTRTARALGISIRSLHYRLRRYGIG